MEAGIVAQPSVVNKVYPRDHPKLEFPDQSNHPLAAAAEKPLFDHRVGKGLGKPEMVGFGFPTTFTRPS
jgi:hypothetical protein